MAVVSLLVLMPSQRDGVIIVRMTPINIDRCYCEQKTFAYLIDLARRERLDVRGLARREGCGTHCGWCIAYLRRGLRTGETAFDYLLPKEELDSDDAPV